MSKKVTHLGKKLIYSFKESEFKRKNKENRNAIMEDKKELN